MKKTLNNIVILTIILMLFATSLGYMVMGVADNTITATAGSGGIISPSGYVGVPNGANQGFTITANPGYDILDVVVDTVSQGAISSYTFYNVITDHTISATFILETPPSPPTGSGDYLGYIDYFTDIDHATNSVKCLELSPNGSVVAFYEESPSSKIHITKTSNSTNENNYPSDLEQCKEVVISPNGTYLGYGGYPPWIPGFDFLSINYVSPPTLSWIGAPSVTETTVYGLTFSANSSFVAYSGEPNYKIRIRSIVSPFDWVTNITVPGDGAKHISWSSNDTWIAAASSDGTDAYIYNVSTYTLHKTLTSATSFDDTKDAKFSPDNRFLAISGTTTGGQRVHIYNTTNDFSYDKIIYTSNTTSPSYIPLSFSNDSNHLFIAFNDSILVYNTNTWNIEYTITADCTTIYDMDITSNLTAISCDSPDEVKLLTIFTVNRTVSTNIEYNNVTFDIPTDLPGMQNVIIPVSSTSTSVTVFDNEASSYYDEVFSISALTNNNTYFFDNTNFIVYLRRGGLTNGTFVNLTLIGTHDILFDISFPQYLDVGQYLFMNGMISDSSGTTLNGVIATTHILNSTGYDMITPMKWNCTNGNYIAMSSTNSLPADTYYIKIEFPDPTSGLTLSIIRVLYLSVDPGPFVYVSTNLHFSFYNSNTGIGLPKESFKIYVDDDTNLTGNRIYTDNFKVYTGSTIYYRIDDYFDNQVYPTAGSYKTLPISHIEQQEDIPVTWYDVCVKNLNETIIHISLENRSVFYNVTLFPMDTYHFNVLPRLYNITKTTYNALNGSVIKIEHETINVTNDTFYIISGYTAHLFFGLYNTNEGLGLPWDTLKYYINGERITNREYHTYINNTINITVKDYYNYTMYTGNFTLNQTYTFLDFGLTFHSWLFGNKNEEYYMISLLREGATRWFERGIVPNGEREFLLPSGNYTLRIYNATYHEIYNSTLPPSLLMNNSKVYVIEGANLSEVISGLSVIRGQLLEVQGILSLALHQDIVQVCYNIPTIYSILNPRATRLGLQLVCPEITIIATATNTTTDNNFISRPVMPTTTLTNGTIRVKTDRIYFHWNASMAWANISYGGNYTNYTSPNFPLFIDPFSANVTINASENVTIIRETQFQQEKLFNWLKATQERQEKYFYSTTAVLHNPFVTNITMKEVYVYMGYANDTTPDYVTTKLYDVTNGRYVTMGQNFDCSASGIQFYLDSLTSVNRSFTASYYGMDTQILPSTAYVSVDDYNLVEYNGKSYWHLRAQWVNRNTEAFIGPLGIDFNFTTGEYVIAPQSIIVYDNEKSEVLSKITGEFMYLGSGGLMISQTQVGTVSPNGARTFDVYWFFTEPVTMQLQPNSLHLVIVPEGFPFIGTLDLFYALCIILGAVAVIAGIIAYDNKTHKFNMKIGFVSILCAVLIILLYGGY